jgi:hypothetical protein
LFAQLAKLASSLYIIENKDGHWVIDLWPSDKFLTLVSICLHFRNLSPSTPRL